MTLSNGTWMSNNYTEEESDWPTRFNIKSYSRTKLIVHQKQSSGMFPTYYIVSWTLYFTAFGLPHILNMIPTHIEYSKRFPNCRMFLLHGMDFWKPWQHCPANPAPGGSVASYRLAKCLDETHPQKSRCCRVRVSISRFPLPSVRFQVILAELIWWYVDGWNPASVESVDSSAILIICTPSIVTMGL